MAQIAGFKVGPIGYGMMGLSWRPQPPPLEQALDAMKAAVNNGCTAWSGAEFYGTPEYNSMTILKAYFTKYPEDADKVTIIIKGGISPDLHPNGSPDFIRRSVDNIIAQLGGTKKLDVFAMARRDPNTPLEVTLGFLQKEYIDTGKISAVSLSECSVETINEATKYTKIACVEVELSMFSPDILKNGIAAACAKHDIPIIAYSPIGRGILTGRIRSANDAKQFGRLGQFPRFQDENMAHNLKLVDQVEEIASKKGCTPAQLAITWVRHVTSQPGMPTIIPIPGATTASRVEENSKLIALSEEDMKDLTDLVTNFETAGTRYPQGVPVNT